MEENCSDKDCTKNAKYSCSCDLSLRLCSKHILKHNKTPGVHNEIEIIDAIQELKSKAAIALENVEGNKKKLLNVGKNMITEVATKIQDTMMLLESRRTEIIDLLNLRQFGIEINSKIEEISNINFQKKGGFQESVEKYLSLYENNEISIFKEEIIAIHKSIEESNMIFKEIIQNKSKESESFTKKFEFLENKLNENINNINNSISEIQKEILIINQKDDKTTITTLFEDAKNQENKLNQQMNQIKQELIEKINIQDKEYTEKNKNVFESLEIKINDNMNIINNSIIKIQKEISANNDIENEIIKITEKTNNYENKISQEMNQIKQEFIELQKIQEKQYNEIIIKKPDEENLEIKKIFEELQNESQINFTKSIIEINNKLEPIIQHLRLDDDRFSDIWKSKNILYTNNRLSVTRIDEPGWGSALWCRTYNKGCIKINFHVDYRGSENQAFLFIGIIKAAENYNLMEGKCLKDQPNSWCWQEDGRFYSNGGNVTLKQVYYNTGDVATLIINMEDHVLQCIKNNVLVHTFTNIAEEIMPAICFGGKDQRYSVTMN